MEIEEAIAQLETGIRRLKVQYDLYFSGIARRPPIELHGELDRLVKRHINASFRRYSDRFYFNTLVGRYNSFSELWNKQVRAIEEGREKVGVPAAAPALRKIVAASGNSAAGEAEADPPGVEGNGAEHVVCVLRITDPASDERNMQTLFNSYVTARQTSEGTAPKLSMKSFIAQITRQVESLKASSGCRSVEFRVTTAASQVSLKARPASSEVEEAV